MTTISSVTQLPSRSKAQRDLQAIEEAAHRAWHAMPEYARRTDRGPKIGSTKLVFSDLQR